MKWLFATLVGLNLIVFAGMIASKMLKQHMPVANSQQTTAPPTIIINGTDLVKPTAASQPAVAAASGATPAPAASGGNPANAQKARANAQNTRNETRPQNNAQANKPTEPRRVVTNNDIARSESGTSRAKYKECSARVSMPEDDYHRIKGLLARYPHAASRQVVDNGNGDSTVRMNVVFMQVSDQEASAIQGVVGRYGQLNRSACNR